jgi:hypothetical protein
VRIGQLPADPNGTDSMFRRCRVKRDAGDLMTQPYDADYWRRRAEEARALAASLTLAIARRELEHIAAAYERLADRAERTAGRKGTWERS